jgi:peptidylprolyl isomerase
MEIVPLMKSTVFTALLLAATVAAAQTATKPAPKAAVHAAAARTTLPANIPPVKALTKTAFALRYQDVKIGTGPVAEPRKLYKVAYTGWLAADGRKFDSSYDHPAAPVIDENTRQPIKDADGKVKTAAAQPIIFLQGFGHVIPGWDQGFEGMHVGGKRRLFIPYQLAYGDKGRQTGDPKNPGIPAKADLIFDIELIEVFDVPYIEGIGGSPRRAEAKPAAEAAKPAAAEPTKSAEPAAPAAPATQPK